MMRLFIICLFGLSFQISYGQAELEKDFDKAVNSLKSREYQKAEKEFTGVLNKAMDKELKKFCYIYRAFSYNGIGEYEKAIADLDKAIELDPADLASYTDRGKAKGYANDLDGAKEDFLFILSTDSTGVQAQAALYYLGKIEYQQVRYAESIKYYNRLITLMPNDAEAYFDRGVAKGMVMDIAGSINDYDKAIKLEPNYKEAYANRGVAKINLLRRNGTIQLTKAQTADACTDLKKAKQMGDNAVDDMIFVHCDMK